MTEFEKYLKQAREEFSYEVSKYTVENNLALRTSSDSLLIAFDQATAKAINYSQCCTELKDKEVPTFEEWIKIHKCEKTINEKIYIKNGHSYFEEELKRWHKEEFNL
tara:strand:+ start:138 stop:458 length:321 start_codon:yes stop_codon:yes gene_type:complete